MLMENVVAVKGEKLNGGVPHPVKSVPIFDGASLLAEGTCPQPDQAGFGCLAACALRGRGMNEFAVQYDVGLKVGVSLNLKEIAWSLYRESRQVVNSTNFALAIYDAQNKALDFPLAVNQGQRLKPFLVKPFHHQGLLDEVLTRQTPLLVRDLLETDYPLRTDPLRSLPPTRTWLGVPIRHPQLPHAPAQGLIIVWSEQANAFTDRQVRLLSALGPPAALAIRNAQLFQALAVENARLHENLLAERDRTMETEAQVCKEIARNLHDGPTQLVSAIVMRLDFCRSALERDLSLLPVEFAEMQALGERAIHQMRTLLVELRPLELEQHGQGLAAALRVLLERRQKEIKTTRLDFKIKTCHGGEQISRQQAQVETAIFMIVQETVNNALKHAQASHILVYLEETPTEIWVRVVDDGKGFEVSKVMWAYAQRSSLGMLNIRERAEAIGGKLVIRSALNRGTNIFLKVPKAKAERMRARACSSRTWSGQEITWVLGQAIRRTIYQ